MRYYVILCVDANRKLLTMEISEIKQRLTILSVVLLRSQRIF